MTLQESLRLERYKLVTERQKYFTELAKETFNSYARTFVAFTAGAVTLISLKTQLRLAPDVVLGLLQAIAALLSLVAVISIGQIVFCLVRWYGFRNAECQINPECPKPEWWAWIFEGLYSVGIAVSVGITWWGVAHFRRIFEQLSNR